MARSTHLYKLFHNSEQKIKINIPRTIIRGFGFSDAMYLRNIEGVIHFTKIPRDEIPVIIKSWDPNPEYHPILKQNNSTQLYAPNTPLSQEFICQEYIENAQKVSVIWDLDHGLTGSTTSLTELEPSIELIKLLINTEIQSKECKLNRLELYYLYSKSTYYCLGISLYSYISTKETKDIKLPGIRKKKKITAFASKNKLSVKDKIDQAIKEITRHKECIKNISYKSWIDKVTKGEKLYPNEALFAKNIVNKAAVKGQESVKCIKQLKLLSMQMRISLSEKKVQASLQEGIRMKIEKVLNSQRKIYTIKTSLLPTEKSPNLNEITERSARNLLNHSINDLSLVSQTCRRFSVE